MAAAMALESGFQVALMVPTEILARQHALKISQLLNPFGFSTQLVLGGDKAETTGQLLVGTQALISGERSFDKLGLVIIDEQHRFGVNQRQTLKEKAGWLPHLLTMTATPIPRSLALTVYGDLDISVIDTLPPGRQPIETQLVAGGARTKIYDFIDTQIGKGRQVFVVCPLVEESDKLGAKSVTSELDRLSKTVFSHRRLAGLHGKMKSEEKQRIMGQFAAGQVDILVASSVIEVGIDIPNATIMMIEGAERFGLAALHQLRGRVGRGEFKSYCYLLSDNLTPPVAERLRAMEKTSDGFRLAQIDLELRGPGQIYGQRQHGALDLRMADLGDVKLISQARTAAIEFLAQPDAMLKYPRIGERIAQLKTVTTLD
jgi:ATP-dependent DNA helicase RecG